MELERYLFWNLNAAQHYFEPRPAFDLGAFVAWGLWRRTCTSHALWGQDPSLLLTTEGLHRCHTCYWSRGIKDMLIPFFKSTTQYTQYTPTIYLHSLIRTMCRNSLLYHLRGYGRRTVTLYPNGDRIHGPDCSCISVTTPMAN
jgi:hypothetical protein